MTMSAGPTGPICPVCGRIAQMTWVDERERRHYMHRQETTAVLPLECVEVAPPSTVGDPEAKPVGEGGVHEGLGKGIGDVGDASGLPRGG